jgi:ATP/maltotriose-dependent transcriptional regulator MalT
MNLRYVLQIFELLEQSKGCEGGSAEGEARDDFEEELASLVTGGDLQPTRSYVNRRFTVYFAALRAFAELGNATAVKSVIEMLEQAGYQVDASSVTELVKCHIAQGDLENAVTVFDKFVESGKNPTLNLYITLIQGCLMKLNAFKLASAKRLLEQMDQRGYFLNTIIGSNLLTLASNEYVSFHSLLIPASSCDLRSDVINPEPKISSAVWHTTLIRMLRLT